MNDKVQVIYYLNAVNNASEKSSLKIIYLALYPIRPPSYAHHLISSFNAIFGTNSLVLVHILIIFVVNMSGCISRRRIIMVMRIEEYTFRQCQLIVEEPVEPSRSFS